MDFCSSLCAKLLLNEIQKKGSKDRNVVVSPLSFHAILNMIAAGATGHTLQQMLSFLGCNSVQDLNSKFSDMMEIACKDNGNKDNNGGDGPIVSFVNGIWVDRKYPLTDSYSKFVKAFCKSEAKNYDFATQAKELVADANSWAENDTRGLIKNVLNEENISFDTKCLLGNALYFKGVWKDGFKPYRTKKMDFYLLSGEKVSVPFMTGCKDYRYGSFDGFKIVKIPYRTGGKEYDEPFGMYTPIYPTREEEYTKQLGMYIPHPSRGEECNKQFGMHIPYQTRGEDYHKPFGMYTPYRTEGEEYNKPFWMYSPAPHLSGGEECCNKRFRMHNPYQTRGEEYNKPFGMYTPYRFGGEEYNKPFGMYAPHLSGGEECCNKRFRMHTPCQTRGEEYNKPFGMYTPYRAGGEEYNKPFGMYAPHLSGGEEYCNKRFRMHTPYQTREEEYNKPFGTYTPYRTGGEEYNKPLGMYAPHLSGGEECCNKQFRMHTPCQTRGEEYSKPSGMYTPYRTRREDQKGGEYNKKFAMYILLPDEMDGLENLLQKVDADPSFLAQNFKLWNQELSMFWIPKFKFGYTTNQGRETLMKMGLELPFRADCRELTEMVDIDGSIPDFYFSNIIQKAFIEVDEEGTKAAAVTFTAGLPGSAFNPSPLPSFVADHPFMFMIKEESSGLVLFTGAVLNPC